MLREIDILEDVKLIRKVSVESDNIMCTHTLFVAVLDIKSDGLTKALCGR